MRPRCCQKPSPALAERPPYHLEFSEGVNLAFSGVDGKGPGKKVVATGKAALRAGDNTTVIVPPAPGSLQPSSLTLREVTVGANELQSLVQARAGADAFGAHLLAQRQDQATLGEGPGEIAGRLQQIAQRGSSDQRPGVAPGGGGSSAWSAAIRPRIASSSGLTQPQPQR